MKKFLLMVLAVLGFVSQAGSRTQITLDQIAAPNATGVMVDIPGRGWVQAQLDPTLLLDTTTTPPTLKAPGGGVIAFVDGVTPTGAVDGVNVTFGLPTAPKTPASLLLAVNGIINSAGVDYSISGGTVTFVSTSTPAAGSILRAWYR